MQMIFGRFWNEENGNTTVDWIVLTAGLVLLATAVMLAVGPGSQGIADQTADALRSI